MTLTERKIRDAKPGPTPIILWDSAIRGLGAKIFPTGAKSYVLDYRIGGRQRRMTVARVGELTLKAARERAGAELARIRDGDHDPMEKRRAHREAPTVADAFERFLGPFADRRIANGRMTERTRTEYAKQARTYVLPRIGRRKVESITRADVERMIETMPGPTGNRVLALCSRLFNLCETWAWRPQNTNPAKGVERAVETARNRVLAPSELSALAAALDAMEVDQPATVAALKVCMVTGLRISEVLAFEWHHVNVEVGRVHMPRTKTGARDHDLPALALAILAALPQLHGNPWCFTNGRGAPVTYKHARNVFAKAAVTAGLTDVRVHDLRRTFATTAAGAGLSAFALKDLLGWKTTAMPERYVNLAGDAARQHRQAIGNAVAAMMDGKSADVVPLRRNG